MTVKEIVTEYLKDNGYDGLCSEECGCAIDDLMPCNDDQSYCSPGYMHSKDCRCKNCKDLAGYFEAEGLDGMIMSKPVVKEDAE